MVRLDTSSLTAYFAKLDRYVQSPAFMEAFVPAFDRALKEVLGAVKRRIPVGVTGRARNDVRSLKIRSEQGLEGFILYPDNSPASIYGPIIEEGRLPGTFPNISPGGAFYNWVMLKIRQAHRNTTGKMLGKKKAEEQVQSAMFLIGRAIMEHGIKPKHPFALGWAEKHVPAYEIILYGVSKGIERMAAL